MEWFTFRAAEQSYMAHGYCISWEPGLISLHVGADALTALAYYSIPIALAVFAIKRTDLTLRWPIWLAAAFILLCGTTHIVAAVTMWEPIYWTEGVAKALTAVVSLAMAIAMWPLLPKALAAPTNSQLRAANEEIAALNQDLERRVSERTADLDAANRRLQEEIEKQQATEAALRDARAQAVAASQAKSDFLAAMSHEVRTPLNTVVAYSEVIADQVFGADAQERYREYAHDIHESGRHLLSLISDVLDLSKVEAGRIELHEEHFDLAEAMRTATRMLRPRADDQEVALADPMGPEGLKLLADRRMVVQVLANLLTNAIKFTRPGGHVDMRASLTPSGGLTIEVNDDGIGMGPEDLARAFIPFRRAGADAYVSRTEGVGLGLALCKRFMERHSGAIQLESVLDKGTRAILTFPAARVGSGA